MLNVMIFISVEKN